MENMEKVVHISLGQHSFQYHLTSTNSPQCLELLASIAADKIFVLCDSNVASIYGSEIVEILSKVAKTYICTHSSGEPAKQILTVDRCLTEIIAHGATRASLVVAFGGGVTGNIAGLVAGLCYRGIRMVHIPTSLMALLDSVISLKQGVNSTFGKNHFGCFLSPELVIADLRFLNTLPLDHIRSGVSEVIKNTLALDPAFAMELQQMLNPSSEYDQFVLEKIIRRGIELKKQILVNDPYEKHDGIVFEYGHTVGHAIEHCVEGKLTHGDCVALGMVVAAHVAHDAFHLPIQAIDAHYSLLESAGSPTKLPIPVESHQIMQRVMRDNKRGYLKASQDYAVMVLLSSLGQPVLTDGCPLTRVPADLLAKHLPIIGAIS